MALGLASVFWKSSSLGGGSTLRSNWSCCFFNGLGVVGSEEGEERAFRFPPSFALVCWGGWI